MRVISFCHSMSAKKFIAYWSISIASSKLFCFTFFCTSSNNLKPASLLSSRYSVIFSRSTNSISFFFSFSRSCCKYFEICFWNFSSFFSLSIASFSFFCFSIFCCRCKSSTSLIESSINGTSSVH